ncbi:hypothetical protein N0V93_006427 [Gnomoniopsis smithogilvyi]|uniref:Uncharacterized protein n=1 Tax=Gnomoniopsis smithogilvyi TaxID=1191159 RepID=A0A9W8YRW0_9PEZI|nr:hypothetical protein N0V93_006427 [Gnomoniopsis smithogilvyi]
MLAVNTFLHVPQVTKLLDIGPGCPAWLAVQKYLSVTNTVVSPGGAFTVNREGALSDIKVKEDFDGLSGLPKQFEFAGALRPGEGRLSEYFGHIGSHKIVWREQNGLEWEWFQDLF